MNKARLDKKRTPRANATANKSHKRKVTTPKTAEAHTRARQREPRRDHPQQLPRPCDNGQGCNLKRESNLAPRVDLKSSPELIRAHANPRPGSGLHNGSALSSYRREGAARTQPYRGNSGLPKCDENPKPTRLSTERPKCGKNSGIRGAKI